MQTALADSLTWQLDWLSKEENGITDRVKGQNIQRKDYIYEDEGYQFDSQFDKYLSLGSTEHYFVYGASFSDKDIKNVNKEYNSASANKEIFYIPSASERRYGLFLQDEITVGNFTITPAYGGMHLKPIQATQAATQVVTRLATTKSSLILHLQAA